MKTLKFKIINNEEYFESREDVYMLVSTFPTLSINKGEKAIPNKRYTFVGKDYIWHRPLIEINYLGKPKVGVGSEVFVLSIKSPIFNNSLISKEHSGILEIIDGQFSYLTFYTSYASPMYNENGSLHTIYGVYKVISQIEGKRLCSIPKKKLLDDFYRKHVHIDITIRSRDDFLRTHQCIGRKKYFIKYKLLRQANDEEVSSLKELPKRFGKSFEYITSDNKYFYVEVKECQKEKKLLYNILNNVRNPKAIVTQEKKKYVISLDLLCYICNYDFGFTKMSGENDIN